MHDKMTRLYDRLTVTITITITSTDAHTIEVVRLEYIVQMHFSRSTSMRHKQEEASQKLVKESRVAVHE